MPAQDQVAHVPNLRPNVPKLRHVGPQLGSSWAPVGRKFYAQLGPKWAPVRPNFRPRTAEFDPVGFWLGQVGPLLSSPSNFLGAGGSHREATRIIGKWVRDDRNERLT